MLRIHCDRPRAPACGGARAREQTEADSNINPPAGRFQMINAIQLRRAITRGATALAAGALVAGCASANKNASSGASSGSSASSSTPGMDMGSGSSTPVAAGNGIKPIPSQLLATTTWQGMKIEARTMTAVPFVIYNGTGEQMVKPPKGTNFHLMVMLNDAPTNEPIPYASVWATFTKEGK